MSDSNVDPELKAIQSIISVLEPLEPEARERVAICRNKVLGYSCSKGKT